MTRKNPAAVSLGRRGGKATARKLTPEQRSASARHAVLARIRKLGQTPRKTAAKNKSAQGIDNVALR